jgi:hypothetical protein
MPRAIGIAVAAGLKNGTVVEMGKLADGTGQGGSATMIEKEQSVGQFIEGGHIPRHFDGRILDETVDAIPLSVAIVTNFENRVNTSNERSAGGHGCAVSLFNSAVVDRHTTNRNRKQSGE